MTRACATTAKSGAGGIEPPEKWRYRISSGGACSGACTCLRHPVLLARRPPCVVVAVRGWIMSGGRPTDDHGRGSLQEVAASLSAGLGAGASVAPVSPPSQGVVPRPACTIPAGRDADTPPAHPGAPPASRAAAAHADGCLVCASNAFALHDLLGRLVSNPRPIAGCLTREGVSVVSYLALRICERLEVELGCCPCVRDPSPRSWRCSRCVRASPSPEGGGK